MFQFEQEAYLAQDREDLIQLLKMRFGDISSRLIEAVYEIDKYETLERLILVAANVPALSTFEEELNAGNGSFKIVGERFNPVTHLTKKGEDYGI